MNEGIQPSIMSRNRLTIKSFPGFLWGEIEGNEIDMTIGVDLGNQGYKINFKDFIC